MKNKRKSKDKHTRKDNTGSEMKHRKTKPPAGAGDKQKNKSVATKKDTKTSRKYVTENKKRKSCRSDNESSSPPRRKYLKENKVSKSNR